MRNTIVRTFNTITAHCTVYVNGALSDSLISLPPDIVSVEHAEKYIRKNKLTSGNLVTVDSLSKSSDIFGMDENTFISNATMVQERGKSTRNCVTKIVSYYDADYIYMDTETREVKKRPVVVPLIYKNKFYKYAKSIEQPGEKAICIENEKEVSKLYAMSESEFMRIGKRMKDYQHFV